jgi:hypothetical protein
MDSQQFYKVKTDYELNSKYAEGLQKIVELYQDPGKKRNQLKLLKSKRIKFIK